MIFFEINQKSAAKISPALIRKIVSVFSEAKNSKKDYYFSLAIVENREIKKLNNCYRGKDQATDVLSFREERDGFVSQKESRKYLGEIVISITKAKEQAKTIGHSLNSEIARLLIHGLAHLFGYEHENVLMAKVKIMEKFEQKVMAKLKL